MSSQAATFYADLAGEVVPPKRGIHSQTLSEEHGVELVLFGFASGESLSEHTSTRPAIIHILSGEADLTAGTDAHHATAGSLAAHARGSEAQCSGPDAAGDGAVSPAAAPTESAAGHGPGLGVGPGAPICSQGGGADPGCAIGRAELH